MANSEVTEEQLNQYNELDSSAIQSEGERPLFLQRCIRYEGEHKWALYTRFFFKFIDVFKRFF